MEYALVDLEPACHLSLAGERLVTRIVDPDGVWHEEFTKYMLESMPTEPYRDLLSAEDSMRARRAAMKALLSPSQRLLSAGIYPRLGCRDAFPPGVYSNDYLESRLFPNEAIASNVRFMSIARNIRARRGCKVSWQVPIAQAAAAAVEEDVLFASQSD